MLKGKKRSILIGVLLISVLVFTTLAVYIRPDNNTYAATAAIDVKSFFTASGDASVSELAGNAMRAENFATVTEGVTADGFTGTRISGTNGQAAYYSKIVDFNQASIDTPFIELLFPKIDSSTPVPGAKVTVTSVINPEKTFSVFFQKRTDAKPMTVMASTMGDNWSETHADNKPFILGESWSTTSDYILTNGNLALNTVSADGSASTDLKDKNNANVQNVLVPVGLYYEHEGQAGRYDMGVYVDAARAPSSRDLQVPIGGGEYRYKVRSFDKNEYPDAPPTAKLGLPFDITEYEASMVEIKVTLLGITPAGGSASIIVTSVMGEAMGASSAGTFGDFSHINGVMINSGENGTVTFDKPLYLNGNTKLDKLVEVYVKPSEIGTPDFEELTINLEGGGTSMDIVLGKRPDASYMTVIAGGGEQVPYSEPSTEGITNILSLNGYGGELPFFFDGSSRADTQFSSQYPEMSGLNTKGRHGSISLYYDAQENALYAEWGRASGPRYSTEDRGREVYRWRIRDFDNVYDNEGTLWNGFGDAPVTMSFKSNKVAGGKQACYIVYAINGQRLSMDEEGGLIASVSSDTLIPKETKSYVSLLTQVPALQSGSVFGGADNLKTEQYYIKVVSPQGEEVDLSGLSEGKWSSDTAFIPLRQGVYTVGYYLNLSEEPVYTTTVTVSYAVGKLTAAYDNGDLTVTLADAPEELQYQYWIKTKVITDASLPPKPDSEIPDNLNKEQYIWQCISLFTSASSITYKVNDDIHLTDDGAYNIIARIKDAGGIVGEVHSVCYPVDAGQVKIKSVSINGVTGSPLYVLDKEQGTVNLNIHTNGAAGTTYYIYSGETLIAPSQFQNGEFILDISDFNEGYYDIRVVADNGTSVEEAKLRAYIFGEYKANEIVVIESLDGTTVQEDEAVDGYTEAGDTEFVLSLKYANGNNISVADFEKYYNITFSTEGGNVGLPSFRINPDTGVLEAVYTTNYAGHGIYRLYGTVSRKAVSGKDDEIIVYYNKYARTASLTQTSDTDNYTVVAGNTINITAEGAIGIGENEAKVDAGDLRYAFYREDASGWVLVKDYSTDNTLTWTPVRPGKYNIQVRVKDVNAGNYEKTANKVYTVTSTDLSSEILTVEVYEYQGGGVAASYAAGTPYKITAQYGGLEEGVLYMFTLYSANLGTVYLNNFTTNNSIMFVPNKNDTYVITARVISESSFGYMDLSKSVTISTGID